MRCKNSVCSFVRMNRENGQPGSKVFKKERWITRGLDILRRRYGSVDGRGRRSERKKERSGGRRGGEGRREGSDYGGSGPESYTEEFEFIL